LADTDFVPTNIFAEFANWMLGEPTFMTKILLPVGVSFFTFQSISYVVDIYREEIKPVKNFFDYTFFVTFFPQLVAGPIVRARDFIPQIHQPFELNKKEYSEAVAQIVTGLLKKVVLADFIAVHFIDKIADAPEAYPGFVSILAMWGYSLQIYGDFSGYTDIAIGLSRLMGFRLLENFNSPYKAINVADFWRRWHKSLGSWLRDYLYIPLGGNRSGGIGTFIATFLIFIFLVFITQWYELFYVYGGLMVIYLIAVRFIPSAKTDVYRDLNLLITMTVGGLWHGASENFVIWGVMNGTALVFYNYWKKISPYENNTGFLAHFWKVFITFNFITFTRIWFRLEDDGAPLSMLNQIVFHFNFTWKTFVLVLSTYQEVFWVMLAGFVIHWLPSRFKQWYMDLFAKMPTVLQVVSVVIIIALMYQAMTGESKAFVYFQF
jgi:D-alanyl-lipoteichoic acid acyltransferase DltB (MBOAT superfamily)